MKSLIIILLSFFTISTSGHNYPFAKNFIGGTIILKDSTQKPGQIKWYPHQNERLQFRENKNGEIIKYSPEEISGFNADTFKFVSLLNIEAYADDYALLGKTTKIKHIFGQLLHSGIYNVYLVLISGVAPLGSGTQVYLNFIFEKKSGNSIQYAAYPFATRMREKKYEKAKENLYIFFKDNPAIIEKVKAYKQEDDFFEIIKLM